MLISLSLSFQLMVALFAAASFPLAHPNVPSLDERAFANATNPKLVFDARMKAGTTPAAFDSSDTSPFLIDGSKAGNLTWSQIITIPKVSPPLFDPEGKEAAIEVSLSDASIYVAKPGYPSEASVRRATLYVNMTNPSSSPIGSTDVVGLKTLHFSLQKNPQRPLNYSHDYALSWMQSANFSREQWWLRAGFNARSNVTSSNMLQFLGNNESLAMFATPFTDGWHNFGIIMDFDHNTVQVLYSTGTDILKLVTKPFRNDLSGGGGYNFGLYKRATGSNLKDGNFGMSSGYQETKINESVIFSSIFMEDSITGRVFGGPTEETKMVE